MSTAPPITVLSSAHKAAIAVLSLDEDLATQVLARLPEDDVRKLAKAVGELGDVADPVLDEVLVELEKAMQRPVRVIGAGARAYIRRITTSAIGEDKATRLLNGVSNRDAAPPPPTHEALRTARVDVLADLLSQEHPQIATMVLTQLPAKLGSRVLRELSPELSADLLARLSSLDEVPQHAVSEAAESVVNALEAAGALAHSDARDHFDGLAFSAAVVNEMPSTDGDSLLERVSMENDEIARRIRQAMFTFEDLMAVDQRQISVLLRGVAAETLIAALQTASDDQKDHFLGALSKRAAETVRDDMAASSPKRLSEVETAQQEIVAMATRMAAEGTITLPSRGDPE